MTSICIRHGTEDDAEFILTLDEQTMWENLPLDKCGVMQREQLRARLLETHGLLLSCPGNVFFIATEEASGERVGLLWFGPRHNPITGEREGWIYNVTVLPLYRKRGVARQLINHAEHYALDQGYAVIGLTVATHNETARVLYQRLDYRESNILMRKPLPVRAQDAA